MKDVEGIKRALSKRPPKKAKPKDTDYLSTGCTLLNLAITGHPDRGYRRGGYYYVVGDSKSGKAQPLESKILTPTGWRLMGEMRVGDLVIDPDGGQASVTGVYPQGMLPVNRVEFSDGTSTECCGAHLWMCQTSNHKSRGRWVVRSTDELREWITCRNSSWFVPVVQPVEYDQGDSLPLPPYLLGVLLGNGHFGENGVVMVSSTEEEIVRRIAALLPADHRLSHRQSGDYCIVRGSKYERYKDGARIKNDVSIAIAGLGLVGHTAGAKFIPQAYLLSSLKDRVELFRGLIDTDGYVGQGGCLEYGTSSLALARDVAVLARSLGGIAKLRGPKIVKYIYRGEVRRGLDHYTVAINLPSGMVPCYLDRKKRRYLERTGNSRRKLGIKRITAITPVGEKVCQCISVSSHRNLYVTDNFIVTHNTFLTLTCMAEAAINPAYDKYRFIFDDVENGALMDFTRFFGPRMDQRVEPPRRDAKGKPIYSYRIEDFYHHLDDAFKAAKPFIYVLDSLDALTSNQERKKFDETKIAARKGTKAKGEMIDGKAKINSSGLRNQMNALRQSGSILLVIGQTRDAVGALPFQPKKTRAGGRAPTFYATCEMWSSVAGKIKKTVRGIDRIVGSKVKIQVQKNRIDGKERSVEVPIFYSAGFDDLGGCIQYLIVEGHWKANKERTKVDAPEYNFKGAVEDLVRKIETEGLERDLRLLVHEIWNEVEAACEVQRKSRYD